MKNRGSLRIHLLLILGLPICTAAGGFELSRALSGHTIAWVYTVEWPAFAIFGVYMWWQLYREQKAEATGIEHRPRRRAPDTGAARKKAPAAVVPAGTTTPDAELLAWEQYLQNLHAVDPPGRAPGQGQ